jgi:hypothetical protein
MFEIQPWHIAAWPKVTSATTMRDSIIRSLGPKASTSFTGLPGKQPRHGQVLWACELDGARAGLAWDWFELRPRVVALADPMNVLSNLEFVDAEGRPLSRGQRLVELNNIIASLPWQCEVVPLQRERRQEWALAA